jgi:phosphoglucomutase
MKVSPLAGTPATPEMLVDVPALIAAYHDRIPDPSNPAQRVAFGTSGHRGSSLETTFNECHVLAISQAICEHRAAHGIDGPLFLGLDTHALSRPAVESALEVLAANQVEVRVASGGEYTPTPAISHAILAHNRGRASGLADGIVVTPSHNPPADGGFKYNPPNGGPADTQITGWIEQRANQLLAAGMVGVSRMPFERAARAATTRGHDFLGAYVADLESVLDLDAIRGAGIRMGVDPLGGAGVHYWARIAEQHRLDLTVVSEQVDPTFGFMTVDWDGQIRMDPSSPYAMRRLIGLKDRYDIAFACDTDHDRHGIVCRGGGLLPSNHFLTAAIDHLLQHRSGWRAAAVVGKTVVTSAMIDRVTARRGRQLHEVPVGFKWFVDGLFDGSLAFGGEESPGASIQPPDGTVWTTHKDGIVAALLSAEITAHGGRDPADIYRALTAELGDPAADRVEAPATADQKRRLAALSTADVHLAELGGERVEHVLDRAPGNHAPIGGIKVVTASGWFAARPSGTEDIYKIYGESFRGEEHLRVLLGEAQRLVDRALGDIKE